jgi:cytochrome c-type biogenesis protein CcmH
VTQWRSDIGSRTVQRVWGSDCLMLLWTILALMTGVAALAALWPLTRRGGSVAGLPSDVAIYKDQLAEIERDRERGLIGAVEAEAARVEVSRRLIAADAARRHAAPGGGASKMRRGLSALIVLVALPLVGLGVYAPLGSPALPDRPLVARLGAPGENASLDELVARVEAHLSANPQDGRGWEVLAPIYRRAGRLADAKQAYQNALRLLGSTPDREADFGETAIMAAGGVVTAEARAAFERAVGLDKQHVKSRYFLGRAKEQDGDRAAAIADWRALLAEAAPGTPVAAFLRGEIKRLGGSLSEPARGPGAAEIEAASKMSPQDRAEMIRAMVQGLDARLRQSGGSLEEWLRLVRAYGVLGEKEKAAAAAADARKALARSPEEVRAVDELVKSLGLEG